MVGYGVPGNGTNGIFETYSGSPLRLKASNLAEVDTATLKLALGGGMAWTPVAGTQLVADFDSGLSSQDALGRLLGRYDSGLGIGEGIITPGDSGGPAFINGQVAGIASYGSSLSTASAQPDADGDINSSFGELAFWQRVSAYQQWIDQSLRASYPDAPTMPAEVKKSVTEGNSGATYAYFLVSYWGARSEADAWLQVNYRTRNGTATAAEDYLAASGTLVLYPDESQVAIPVEILGDIRPEADETFYMDIFNPVGGSFPGGVATLTAVRTILDDDGWMA